MPKTTCSDCGNPKGNSSSISYCTVCRNRRARERYQAQRTGQGYNVQQRSNTPTTTPQESRRQYLLQHSDAPGKCEVCAQDTPTLVLINITPNPNITPDEILAVDILGGEMFGLLCRACRNLLKLLDDAVLHRALQVHAYLRRYDLTLSRIMPEAQDAMLGTIPKPINPNPTATATQHQK